MCRTKQEKEDREVEHLNGKDNGHDKNKGKYNVRGDKIQKKAGATT